MLGRRRHILRGVANRIRSSSVDMHRAPRHRRQLGLCRAHAGNMAEDGKLCNADKPDARRSDLQVRRPIRRVRRVPADLP